MAKSKIVGFMLDGESKMESKTLAKLVGEDVGVVDSLLTELKLHNVYSQGDGGVIFNRRMARTGYISEVRAESGRKGGRSKSKNGSKREAKEESKTKASSASASASASKEGGKGGEEGFNNFWAVYPRKVGKADAISAWKAIDKKDHAAITVAAINYMKSIAKLKTEAQYIKHPATFLRKDRWKDYAFEGKGALAGVTGREGCQYIEPTAEEQEVEKKLRAEYDERLKAFMKERGYKTEEEIPIDIETFSEFKKRMAKEIEGRKA